MENQENTRRDEDSISEVSEASRTTRDPHWLKKMLASKLKFGRNKKPPMLSVGPPVIATGSVGRTHYQMMPPGQGLSCAPSCTSNGSSFRSDASKKAAEALGDIGKKKVDNNSEEEKELRKEIQEKKEKREKQKEKRDEAEDKADDASDDKKKKKYKAAEKKYQKRMDEYDEEIKELKKELKELKKENREDDAEAMRKLSEFSKSEAGDSQTSLAET
jgi:hypothetical protein